jgi:hypothetical protein
MKDFLEPVVETEPRPAPSDPEKVRYLRSYLFMRAMIGAIGVALPFALVLFDGLMFSGEPFPRDSLSAYYYSGVRDVFVGALCATAVFLLTYKVVEKNLDNTLSLVAGAAVLTVALFPTGRPTRDLAFSPLQDRFSEDFVQGVHFFAAAVFLGSLAVLCFFFGVREGKRPQGTGQRRSPTFWRRYHWTCAGVIVAALLFIAIFAFAGQPGKTLLIGEAIAVWAFGASWLMKGLELDILRGSREP